LERSEKADCVDRGGSVDDTVCRDLPWFDTPRLPVVDPGPSRPVGADVSPCRYDVASLCGSPLRKTRNRAAVARDQTDDRAVDGDPLLVVFSGMNRASPIVR
jgi:hypothetical protein